jgi:molybdopterin/thiamine biosynthesis adenylyltransferase
MERLQQLNPMVEVTADTANVKDKAAEFFKDFDIVICTTCSKEELVRINSLCRKDNIMFFGGGVYGFYGYTFMDLVQHEYVEEVVNNTATKEKEEQENGDKGEPAAKKAKPAEEETKTVKKAMTFVSLAETLKVDWSSELYAKRIKRMDPSFFLLQVMYAFEAETGTSPRPSKRAEDLETLKKLRDSTLKTMGVPVEKIPDTLLELLFAELSPVAAIVGGMLGQEVIKAISNKDAPHNNYFFYNPLESCGVVETIGY